jgi:hypothetical protein
MAAGQPAPGFAINLNLASGTNHYDARDGLDDTEVSMDRFHLRRFDNATTRVLRFFSSD